MLRLLDSGGAPLAVVPAQAAVDARLGWRGGAVDRAEPVVDGPGELRVGPHPQFERDLGDADAVRVDELAQLLQPLDLPGTVVPVAPRRAQGGDEAGLLEVAQHPLRPSGRVGCLLDGQGLHHRQIYHSRVRFAVTVGYAQVGAVPATAPAAGPAVGQERRRSGRTGRSAGRGSRAAPAASAASVSGQDRGRSGSSGGEPIGVRLGQRPRRQRHLGHRVDGTAGRRRTAGRQRSERWTARRPRTVSVPSLSATDPAGPLAGC